MVVLAPFIGPALGLAGAALGMGQQASKDRAARKAAEAQNKVQKEQAEAQFKRAQQE